MNIQILLIEDNLSLATTIGDYMQMIGIECDFASNGVAGLSLAKDNQYQAILLDINLPKMNGLEVCRAVREAGIDIPILMLTARDSLQDKLDGFRVGTDDYLVKPFQMEELAARIKALSSRRSGQAQTLRVGELTLDLKTQQAYRAGTLLDITPYGWKILLTLARQANVLVSRELLERALWQNDTPDTDLLKVHLYRLRKKLDRPFTYPMIHTVPNQGVILKDAK